MAPKAAPSAETAELIELFKSIGLTQSKAAEAAKSPKSASALKDIIEEKQLAGKSLDEKTAVLLAALAVQSSKLGDKATQFRVDTLNACFCTSIRNHFTVNHLLFLLESI